MFCTRIEKDTSYIAYNVNGHIEAEGLLKATGSHVHYKTGYIS